MIPVALGPKVPEAAVAGYAARVSASLTHRYGKGSEVEAFSIALEAGRKAVAELVTKHFDSEGCRKATLRYLGLLEIAEKATGGKSLLELTLPSSDSLVHLTSPTPRGTVVIGSGSGPEVAPSTIWTSSLRPLHKMTTGSLAVERLCLIYNLAVLFSGPSPLRAACLFDELSAVASVSMSRDTSAIDFDPTVLKFLKSLLLAQAQGALTEKAEVEKKSPGLIGKLAAEASDMFQTAENAFNRIPSGFLDSSWKLACHLSSLRFSALAQILAVTVTEKIVRENLSGFGVLVSRIRTAISECEEFLQYRDSKCMRDLLKQATTLQSSIEKDNDLIYHESVPSAPEPLPRVNGLGVLPTGVLHGIVEESRLSVTDVKTDWMIPLEVKQGWERIRLEIVKFLPGTDFPAVTSSAPLLSTPSCSAILIRAAIGRAKLAKATSLLENLQISAVNCEKLHEEISSTLDRMNPNDRKVSGLRVELSAVFSQLSTARAANARMANRLDELTDLKSRESLAQVLALPSLENHILSLPGEVAIEHILSDCFAFAQLKEGNQAKKEELRIIESIHAFSKKQESRLETNPRGAFIAWLGMSLNDLDDVTTELDNGNSFFTAATACLVQHQETANRFVPIL